MADTEVQVHAHGSSTPASRNVRGALALIMLPLVVLSIAAVAVLWPSQHEFASNAPGLGAETTLYNGTVERVDMVPCNNDPAAGDCMRFDTRMSEGPERGGIITLSLPVGPGQPDLAAGDEIVLGRSVDPLNTIAYYFSDFQRDRGIIIIGAVFAALVVLVGRWRGLGALVGLVVTFAIVTGFMLPSILEGNPPVYVALAGGALIVLTVLYIAHGVNARTTTALIGTLVSMVITGGLAALAVDMTSLTGLASEETSYVQSFAGQIDIRGLLLGGIILGSLGVLNDVTITQASAVWEVHRAQPGQSRRKLYRSGMRVGRDHIASTVYTLVLAYTGASLPLLILFVLANRPFGDVATTSIVGEEIVRTLVGSIGLILCVPITTALAAIVAKGDRNVDDSDTIDLEALQASATEDEANESTEAEAASDETEDDEVHLSPGAPIGESLPHSGDDSLSDASETVTATVATVPPPVIDPDIFAPRPTATSKNRRRWLKLRRGTGDYFTDRRMGRKERKFWSED